MRRLRAAACRCCCCLPQLTDCCCRRRCDAGAGRRSAAGRRCSARRCRRRHSCDAATACIRRRPCRLAPNLLASQPLNPSTPPRSPACPRLKAYRKWLTMEEPHWSDNRYPAIDFQDLSYYSAPKMVEKKNSLDEVRTGRWARLRACAHAAAMGGRPVQPPSCAPQATSPPADLGRPISAHQPARPPTNPPPPLHRPPARWIRSCWPPLTSWVSRWASRSGWPTWLWTPCSTLCPSPPRSRRS